MSANYGYPGPGDQRQPGHAPPPQQQGTGPQVPIVQQAPGPSGNPSHGMPAGFPPGGPVPSPPGGGQPRPAGPGPGRHQQIPPQPSPTQAQPPTYSQPGGPAPFAAPPGQYGGTQPPFGGPPAQPNPPTGAPQRPMGATAPPGAIGGVSGHVGNDQTVGQKASKQASGPASSRSGGSLTTAIIATAAITAVLAGAGGFFGSKVTSGPPTLDSQAVSSEVRKILSDEFGFLKTKTVSCPENQLASPGHTFMCTFVAGIETSSVQVTVLNEEGQYLVGTPKAEQSEDGGGSENEEDPE